MAQHIFSLYDQDEESSRSDDSITSPSGDDKYESSFCTSEGEESNSNGTYTYEPSTDNDKIGKDSSLDYEYLEDDDLDLHAPQTLVNRDRNAKSTKTGARTHDQKEMQERLSDDYRTDEHNSCESSSSSVEIVRARVQKNMDVEVSIIGVKKATENKIIDLTYDEEEKTSPRTMHNVPTNYALKPTSKFSNTRVKLEFSSPTKKENQPGDSIRDKRKQSNHSKRKHKSSRRDTNKHKKKKDKGSNEGH